MDRVLVDICSFLPVAESYRSRLLGWAAIPGYLRMFAKGLSRFCEIEEDTFRSRVESRSKEEVQEFIEETAGRLGRPVKDFIVDLDEAGYDIAAVFSIDQESTTGAPPLDHEILASAISKFPNRLIAFAGVDPNKLDAADTLERAVRDLGLHGALLVPFLHELAADHRAYRPIFEKCVELDVPVWIHASVNWSPGHPMELGHPRALDRLCGEMPKLKVIAGHGGWPWVPELVAAAWRHPNLYIDPSDHSWVRMGDAASFRQFGPSK